jgi:hypothetical protein
MTSGATSMVARASLSCRFRPVAPAVTLFDGVGFQAAPFQADQFADSQPGPYRGNNHGRVGLGNQFHQVGELLGRDGRLGLFGPLVERQPQPFHGIFVEILRIDRSAENRGQHIADFRDDWMRHFAGHR